MKHFLLLLVIVAGLTLGLTIPVKAHASLVRSVPEAGESLLVSPTEIFLEYNEELDPAASKVDLYDASGQIVAKGPGVIDPGKPFILRLPVDELPDGVYSAVWRVSSAVDGHITKGSVGFSIGEASSPASLLPPTGTPDPATAIPSTFETIVRWLAYISAVTGVGSLTFGFFIWRQAYRRDPNKSVGLDEVIRQQIRRITLVSLVLLGISTLCFASLQTARALEISPWTVLFTSFPQVFLSHTGMLLGMRLIFLSVLGRLVTRLPSPGSGSARLWSVILLLCGLILLTFSLQGHGAARGSAFGVAMTWLHLAATAVWLGGLPLFVYALRRDDAPAAVLVPRYSEAALLSIGILVGTGVYQALTYVKTVEALTATTYGRAIIEKTAIFALLLTIGATNLLLLSPHIRRSSNDGRKWMRRTVRLEMFLGTLLLLGVGVLAGVAPALTALQAREAQGIVETASVDGVRMMLRVMPAREGENEIGVEYTDPRTGVMGGAPEVLIRLRTNQMDLGEQQIRTTSADGLRYTARGSYFTMTGPWELEVIIRRPGYNDVRQTFQVEIQGQPSPE